MKLSLFAAILSAVTLSFIAFLRSSHSSSLVVSPPSVEFASLAQGSSGTMTVRLVNKGNTALHITGVQTSCGCTTSEITRDVVRPHQFVPMRVHFESVGFIGKQTKSVTIHLADGQDDVTVPLHANVYQVFRFSPSEINAEVRVGQPCVVPVRVERIDGRTLPRLSFSKVREAEVKVTPLNAKSALLNVVLRPAQSAGIRHFDLLMSTGLHELPTVSVPVSFTAKGNYSFAPTQLNFGVVRGNATQFVLIKRSNTSELSSLKIVSLPPAFTASFKNQGQTASLTIKCKSDGSKRIVNGFVTLKTGQKQEPFIQIPLVALLSR